MELEELVKAVAALTATVDKMQGAMDEAEGEKKAAKDEDEKKAKEEADKKAMDDAEAEKKAAEEEAARKAKEEEDGKKSEAMDAALKHVKELTAKITALEAKPAAMDSAAIMVEIAKKNDLASRASHFIGSFAHDSMTLKQTAEYIADQLKLPKDNAEIRVESYLAGRPSPSQAYGMDSIDVQKSTGAAYLATHVK